MATQKQRESKKPIPLSKGEKAFFAGLQAREREIQREFIAPLQDDYAEFIKQLEHNHGVEVGKDYALNSGTLELIPLEGPVEEAKAATEKE